jgi:uncharacterized protein (TIGR02421 family)
MEEIIDDDLMKIDQFFFDVFKYLNLIRHVNPTNVDLEKQRFFGEEIRNPVFEYKLPRINVGELREELKDLFIPDNNLGKVYEQVRRGLLKRCDIIESIGNDDSRVRDLTSEIYGWPSDSVVRYAKKLLLESSREDVRLNVSSEEVSKSLRDLLSRLGLNDWRVKYVKKWLTTTKHNKKICVCKKRTFSEGDVKRLAVHEVGVHAARYANGYLQRLKIFIYGFPDFLKTEEGMATYFEELTGNSSINVFRNYAGRVIAIDCLHREKDFRDCYLELVGYGFSFEDSWNLAVRVYRGGGFVKDHVYLEGYLMVKRFAEEGGDFKKLYVGKVGIEDLEFVDELLGKGWVREAMCLPEFVN